MPVSLTISRSIVESHGGRLWATGNSDRGATFQFTLPVETCRDCDGINITSVLQDLPQKCSPCEVGVGCKQRVLSPSCSAPALN